MVAARNPVVKKAVVELKRLSQSEEAQRLYEAREKALRDENSRLRTAVNKRDREIVINLIEIGLPNEQINKVTGLTITEIEKIKAKQTPVRT